MSETSVVQDLATPGQRIQARILDGLIPLLVIMLSIAPSMLSMLDSKSSSIGQILTGMWLVVCIILYLTWYVRLLGRGKTPGKHIIGIHVLDLETQQPAGFLRNGFLREFLVAIIYGIPVIGLIFQITEIVMLFQPSRRTPRDLLAHTIVVQG